jgi:hypothetical protein
LVAWLRSTHLKVSDTHKIYIFYQKNQGYTWVSTEPTLKY